MKIFSKVALIVMLFSFILLATSCLAIRPSGHHDNGKHKGWYKSPQPKSIKVKGKKSHGNNKNISMNKIIKY